MGRITGFIAKGLVVAVAGVIPATLLAGAAPAHAATHWQVDKDGVVLGASSTNDFKAFNGSVESWLDGSTIRATLTGPFVGRGTLKATWIFADNSTATNSDYTAGVQHDINFTSPSGKTVVRFTFRYTPNSGSVDETTKYVGDSPDSVGDCTRLDRDALSLNRSGYATYSGTVNYTCDNSGHVQATVSGTTTWASGDGTSGCANIIFWYSDGSVATVSCSPANSTHPTVTTGATSSSTKQIEWVGVRMQRGSDAWDSLPQSSVSFGE
jgi:hypothetical protein